MLTESEMNTGWGNPFSSFIYLAWLITISLPLYSFAIRVWLWKAFQCIVLHCLVTAWWSLFPDRQSEWVFPGVGWYLQNFTREHCVYHYLLIRFTLQLLHITYQQLWRQEYWHVTKENRAHEAARSSTDFGELKSVTLVYSVSGLVSKKRILMGIFLMLMPKWKRYLLVNIEWEVTTLP